MRYTNNKKRRVLCLLSVGSEFQYAADLILGKTYLYANTLKKRRASGFSTLVLDTISNKSQLLFSAFCAAFNF